MTVAVVAEKPSVARDIARMLGATTRGDGFLSGGGYVVTWAIGHLVALAEPDEIDPRWARWRTCDLPMVPEKWALAVLEGTRAQFDVVRKILTDKETTQVISATDAGREGELIFRYIYEAAGSKKPVKRLWLSSLTDDAIEAAFRKLRPESDLDPLANAARARSRADWLVGLNFSRLYSLRHDAMYSVGRVQTPTLAMLVSRELEVRAFVPENYFEIVAEFQPEAAPEFGPSSYRGVLLAESGEAKRQHARLPGDGALAKEVVVRVRGGHGEIESVDRETHSIPPPRLYDLTELQRHANRLFGMSAQRTLDTAQALYEKHKLLSYPRTDSRHLSEAVAKSLGPILSAIAPEYAGLVAERTFDRPLGRRFMDDSMVTDHHAIIPTPTPHRGRALGEDESRIYDLVCRRLLSAWHVDHVYASTHVVTRVTSGAREASVRDRFLTTGTSIEQPGWKVLDLQTRAAPKGDDTEPAVPPGLAPAMKAAVLAVASRAKKTRPPPRYTDAMLLTAMESAGRELDEAELSNAIRDFGLGTPATRAAIVETLIRREYVVRDAKLLVPTENGIALVNAVHPKVKSPLLTGEWERALRGIERGERDSREFMADIERFVREVVGDVRDREPEPPRTVADSARTVSAATRPTSALFLDRERLETPVAPVRERVVRFGPDVSLGEILRRAFGFDAFRPYQEEVCKATVAGRDVLLVMPTGAGKSLCYQLPGLARGGTTLVVSPLIALMEDQVAKLKAAGLAAERIHSGRDRQASRAVCRAYLDGEIDYLFVAPERLRVPGFVPMLARRTPSLIAVDEAHCISQWGHDFRPDYRTLGEWVAALRPAPVIALTATATPTVQDDIVKQLGLTDAARFIHGFRRINLAIEVIEQNPGQRTDTVARLLGPDERRPAILYAPTRKHAEQLAAELSSRFRAAAYHAGMTGEARDRIQSAFLGSRLDVVVATVAFGMGIDKADVRTVIHTALPATVEGYYQEIGRAGRDGFPSRAILLQSFVDRKTHEFFFERDYPTSAVLRSLFVELSASPKAKESLQGDLSIEPSVFDKALEKLWIHGGALVTPDETIVRGHANWEASYEAQRRHRQEQLDRMQRFAATETCRMLQLVRHFGDDKDAGASCGVCDSCAPASCVARKFREPSSAERVAIERIEAALRERNGVTLGQLHRDLFQNSEFDRSSFQHLVFGMARAQRIRLEDDAFEKGGETIVFQRAWLIAGANTSAIELEGSTLTTVKSKRVRGQQAGKKSVAPRPRPPKSASPPATSEAKRRSKGDAPAPATLMDELRAWRLLEARKKGIPAFRIMSDRTLAAIADDCPTTEADLLQVHGVGPALTSKFGHEVLRLVVRFRGSA